MLGVGRCRLFLVGVLAELRRDFGKPYADLNVGDKVIVHEKDWTGKVIQHEPAFFYDVRYSRYSFHNPDCIELVLHKAKKDGTMSKLEKSIYVRRIVAVQKVTE